MILLILGVCTQKVSASADIMLYCSAQHDYHQIVTVRHSSPVHCDCAVPVAVACCLVLMYPHVMW